MIGTLKNDEQYNTALARVYDLMQKDVGEGSAFSNELESLSIAVKEYEVINYPLSSCANSILDKISVAIQEVDDIKEGRLKGKDFDDLLNEL